MKTLTIGQTLGMVDRVLLALDFRRSASRDPVIPYYFRFENPGEPDRLQKVILVFEAKPTLDGQNLMVTMTPQITLLDGSYLKIEEQRAQVDTCKALERLNSEGGHAYHLTYVLSQEGYVRIRARLHLGTPTFWNLDNMYKDFRGMTTTASIAVDRLIDFVKHHTFTEVPSRVQVEQKTSADSLTRSV